MFYASTVHPLYPTYHMHKHTTIKEQLTVVCNISNHAAQLGLIDVGSETDKKSTSVCRVSLSNIKYNQKLTYKACTEYKLS